MFYTLSPYIQERLVLETLKCIIDFRQWSNLNNRLIFLNINCLNNFLVFIINLFYLILLENYFLIFSHIILFIWIVYQWKTLLKPDGIIIVYSYHAT